MLSSRSRYRFVLLVGLASCRQACGLTLAEDGSGANGGGGVNGGGGANAGGGNGGGGEGAGEANSSSSGTVCRGPGPLRTDFDGQGPSLIEAGCGESNGGTCEVLDGEFHITPSANSGFWNGGPSTFVQLNGAAQCDSFLAHTLVEFVDWPAPNQAFSLAGLVLRDSNCPANQGSEAVCNDWFKAEVGRLSDLALGYPDTSDNQVGLRSAVHNLLFSAPPLPANVEDVALPPNAPAGQYQLAICAINDGNSFQVDAAFRIATADGTWARTMTRDLSAAEVEVGLVAARGTTGGFIGRFDYLEILPIDDSASDPCTAAFNSIPLP